MLVLALNVKHRYKSGTDHAIYVHSQKKEAHSPNVERF